MHTFSCQFGCGPTGFVLNKHTYISPPPPTLQPSTDLTIWSLQEMAAIAEELQEQCRLATEKERQKEEEKPLVIPG